MKILINAAILLLFFFTAMGQGPGGGLNTLVDPVWQLSVQVNNEVWRGDGNYTIVGTAFYDEEMRKGYVSFSDGKSASDVLLRYNLYSHQIYYMEDKAEMMLSTAAPVQEFGFSLTKDGVQKNIVFRTGYPAIGKNDSKTFYEVVAGGDIVLLKYTTKRILEESTAQGTKEKVLVDADWWYIYNASDKTMVEIKKNKNSLLEALPQYASRIREIMDTKKLRLKSDQEWAVLLNELSTPKAF